MISEKLQQFWQEEDGIGTLEILLIIAVIVIIAIAFRKWIMKWVKKLFESADSELINQNTDSNDLLPANSP
ncbi:MAG: Flp1 family type IVb pilin [Paenibacillaceae bacterium]